MRNLNMWIVLFLALTLTGCEIPEGGGGGSGDSNKGGQHQPLKPEDFGKRGPDSSMINYVHIDLADAKALVTLQKSDKLVSSGLGASLPQGVLQKAASSDSGSPMYKIMVDGAVKPCARVFDKQSNESFSESDEKGINKETFKRLPHISYMAVNNYDEVFVVFEHGFIYKDTAKIKGQVVKIQDYQEPWSMSSPFSCQFFKVNQKLKEYGNADKIQRSNLQCITEDRALELNTWDPRAGQIQFDDKGNLYFTAHIPGNWKNVMLKRDRISGDLTEVINANIQFRDYLVTKLGGVIYTGQTSTDGNFGGGGSSFFRFVTPSGELKEVVRDWWEYVFQPVNKGTYSGQILFYGPSTLTSTTPGWDTACIYRFDPGKNDDSSTTDIDERAVRVANCQNDFHRYVNGTGLTSATRKTRCEEASYNLGSGSQPKELLLTNLDSDEADEIVYIGKIRKKVAGEWFCDVSIAANQAHCTDAQNNLIGIGECSAGTGTTVNVTNERSYNNVTNSAICTSTNVNVTRPHEDCRQPASNWGQELGGLAMINDDASVTLLSKEGEEVVKAWIIDSVLYYSSFATGIYRLKKVALDSSNKVTLTTLLDNIEVYKLTQDPKDKKRLFLNALNFKNNSFVAGDFDPSAASPEATLSTRSELTGVIDTILIFQ